MSFDLLMPAENEQQHCELIACVRITSLDVFHTQDGMSNNNHGLLHGPPV